MLSYIDVFFYGLLGYADNLSLISPTNAGIQRMFIICANYFKLHGINNSVNIVPEKSKTQCLAFNVNGVPASICFDDFSLPWTNHYKHLGHYILY